MNILVTIKQVIHWIIISKKHKGAYNTCREAQFYFSKTSGSNRTYVDVVRIICLIQQTQEELNMLCEYHCYFFFIHLQ
jgi:hypothetical protein